MSKSSILYSSTRSGRGSFGFLKSECVVRLKLADLIKLTRKVWPTHIIASVLTGPLPRMNVSSRVCCLSADGEIPKGSFLVVQGVQ